jgi:hypothetical protein
MPILTQPTPASQRRRPWLWVVLGLPGMVLALLVGLVAWSWDHPITFAAGKTTIGLGRTLYEVSRPYAPGWDRRREPLNVLAVPVPGDDNRYKSPYVIYWSF